VRDKQQRIEVIHVRQLQRLARLSARAVRKHRGQERERVKEREREKERERAIEKERRIEREKRERSRKYGAATETSGKKASRTCSRLPRRSAAKLRVSACASPCTRGEIIQISTRVF
jgi:hypothetical protein